MSKISKNEKGIGAILLTVLIVLLVVVVAGTIYELTKKPAKTATVTTTTKTATTPSGQYSATCYSAFHDKALCTFANHTNISTQQYVATGTTTSATGAQSTFTVKNDGMGNSQISYTNSGKTINEISLDGKVYIQTSAGGTWLEYDNASLGASTVPNPTSGFNLNFQTSTPAGVTVTSQGTAACGNSTCDKYKVITNSNPNATQYVYFDTSSYLLRQWTSSDASTGIKVNLTFSYEPVTIQTPSPVQQITT